MPAIVNGTSIHIHSIPLQALRVSITTATLTTPATISLTSIPTTLSALNHMTSALEALVLNNSYKDHQDNRTNNYQDDPANNNEFDQVVPIRSNYAKRRESGNKPHHRNCRALGDDGNSNDADVPTHASNVVKAEYAKWLQLRGELGNYKSRRGERDDSDTESYVTSSAPASAPASEDVLDDLCVSDKTRAYARRRNDHLCRAAAARLHRAVLSDEEVWWVNQHARGDLGRDSGFVRSKQDRKALRNKVRGSGKGSFKYDIREDV